MIETIELIIETDETVYYCGNGKLISETENLTEFQKIVLKQLFKQIPLKVNYSDILITVKLSDDNFMMFDIITN